MGANLETGPPDDGNAPPAQAAARPPAIAPAVPEDWVAPPPQPKSALRKLLVLLLSFGFALFLADGIISLLDDSLIVFAGIHSLAGLRAVIFCFTVLFGIGIYVLMALTPMIPKRFFLPITLFNPLAGLAFIPFLIYYYNRMEQMAWVISLCQVAFGLMMLWWLSRANGLRWPLVSEGLLGVRRFSWLNLFGFILANILLLAPAVLCYLFFCASLAAGHFSEGFVALRPSGLVVQARKYVRKDGKIIQLVPMAHIGQGAFYHDVLQSFDTNSVVLMEGVSDRNNLLTNRITYKRVAASLGLTEQQREFKPTGGDWVRADVDVEEFSPETIAFLNLVMRLYTKGVNLETILPLVDYRPAPGFDQRLFDDLLRKRNRHLLEEIQTRLPESGHLIVPWGAAHMPEIARTIQTYGFHLQESQEHHVIRFFGSHAVTPKPDKK